MFTSSRSGFAALTTLMLIFATSLVVVSGFAFFAVREQKTNSAYLSSVRARYVAEGGVEDAVYRVVTGKQIAGSEDLGVGTGTTTISVTTSGNTRTIRSEGSDRTSQKNIQTTIDVSTETVNFFYGLQVGDGGISMDDSSTIIGNVYSTGNINDGTITGSATVAGGITDTPQVQWATNDKDFLFATTSASRDAAQSFTANATGQISKISVYLAKVGSPGSNLTLRITADSSGKPSTGTLAQITITPASVGLTANWIDLTFGSPPTLTSGTKYWIVLDYSSNSTTNYWNWRKDSSDGYAGNTGRYANDYSSGSATWINAGGDFSFRVWIGGTLTNISNATVAVAGHANVFVNDTIGGSACPNANCIVENPPHQPMPISDGVIQDWRDEAAAGGTCSPATTPACDASGNLSVSGTKSIGPMKIPGNLSFTKDSILILTGTVWVAGNIDISKDCTIKLNPSYGAYSGLLLSDGTVNVAKDSTFQGSGTAGSYIMILSAKDAPTSTVMDVSKDSNAVIYYAAKGRIHMSKDGKAREMTAYGIDMDKDTTITYEAGLANLNFSSGPSGGYILKSWKEVQ